jgi:thimet oligopeptidase
MAGSALSLNRAFTRRWRPSTWTGASPATQHFVERTLLGYRLAGVDKDQATRDHLQALHEKATRLSLEFSRNIQEGGKTIEATRPSSTACPPTTSPATRPTPRAASPSPPTSPTCSR